MLSLALTYIFDEKEILRSVGFVSFFPLQRCRSVPPVNANLACVASLCVGTVTGEKIVPWTSLCFSDVWYVMCLGLE